MRHFPRIQEQRRLLHGCVRHDVFGPMAIFAAAVCFLHEWQVRGVCRSFLLSGALRHHRSRSGAASDWLCFVEMVDDAAFRRPRTVWTDRGRQSGQEKRNRGALTHADNSGSTDAKNLSSLSTEAEVRQSIYNSIDHGG
jgi:hypothetical protein